MKDAWWQVLVCPRCGGDIAPGQGRQLVCQSCGQAHPVNAGVPILLRGEELARFTAFTHQYRADRLAEGWRPLRAEEMRELPYGRPQGYPRLYWEVRRQSYEALHRLLTQDGPQPEDGPVADLGAGNGWLSYRLAQQGYFVVAVDANVDDYFGLGASLALLRNGRVSFLPVQGNLEDPPLRDGAFSLAIFNASLHYTVDLQATLGRIGEKLRPGGRLAILDTPVAGRPRVGERAGDRHLGRRELQEALLGAGFQARWVRVTRGDRWWWHQFRILMRGGYPFAFPLIWASRGSSPGPS